MKHFLSSEMENTPRDRALFHVIPAPMEMSVSYGGGTAGGPQAILDASDQLESWDGQSSPMDEGIHTCAAVSGEDAPAFLKGIRMETERTLASGGIPVLLGGEHTVTLGAAEAFFMRYGRDLGLVQIDAHADLRHNYEGNPYSHASVIRKVHERTGWPVIQLGIRAFCEEERDYQKEQNILCVTGREAALKGLMEIELPDDFPENVYLTFDADGLDSALMPATGTPVPGGLGWYQTMSLIESLAARRRIVGFDFVELAPSKENSWCDFSAAQGVYNIMGMIQRGLRN